VEVAQFLGAELRECQVSPHRGVRNRCTRQYRRSAECRFPI
jgi:hypothetical protein